MIKQLDLRDKRIKNCFGLLKTKKSGFEAVDSGI